MKILIITFLVLNNFIGFTQIVDTLNKDQKFEFRNYHNDRVKKIKKGQYLDVVSTNGDTINTKSGDLILLNDSVLVLELAFEDNNIINENYTYLENFKYQTPVKISIPIKSIDYLNYEAKTPFIGAAIGGLSLLTALFIAPIVAIDKTQPYNFNSKQYTQIMGPALIGSAIGLTLYYTIGSDTMVKIKIPTK
jgi:hypothetical protein